MKFKQNIPLFNYERGDKITVAQVNLLIKNAYLKFNNLIPDNVKELTTAQFRGEIIDINLIYPNYCGTMSSDLTKATCDNTDINYGMTDNMCMKLVREADEILKYLREV